MTDEQKSRIPSLYFSKQYRNVFRHDEVCARIALKLNCKASAVYNYINSFGLAYPNLEYEVNLMMRNHKYKNRLV